MDKLSVTQRIWLALILAAILFAVLFFFFPKDEKKEPGVLRVGAGKDITGLLLERIVEEAESADQTQQIVTSYVFVDCCSNTAQWALQAEELDLGFYCSAAARTMVNKVDGFIIYAPAIMNSEVIAVLPDAEALDSVGIPRKRLFLGDLVKEHYQDVQEIREIDRTYIAYSVKLGEVSGAVLDVADASAVAEDFRFLPLTNRPYISYCLVVREDLVDTVAFHTFLEYYARAIEKLSSPDEKLRLMKMDPSFWEMTGLEFLPITEQLY